MFFSRAVLRLSEVLAIVVQEIQAVVQEEAHAPQLAFTYKTKKGRRAFVIQIVIF